MKKNSTTLLIFLIFLSVVGITCQATASQPARNAEIIQVSAGTSLQTWLDQAAEEFNQQKIKSADNQPYYVEITYEEAGQAIAQSGEVVFEPDLWIPDNYVWAEMLAENGNPAYLDDCRSVATSPLVIAMWQPIAESLGWPGRNLGWLDIGSLAADPYRLDLLQRWSVWLFAEAGAHPPGIISFREPAPCWQWCTPPNPSRRQ